MKLLKLLVSCCLLVLLVLGNTKANSPYDYLQDNVISGSGTEDDPYILNRSFSQISYFD